MLKLGVGVLGPGKPPLRRLNYPGPSLRSGMGKLLSVERVVRCTIFPAFWKT